MLFRSPIDLVFVQTRGSADYKKMDTTNLSIRALHLLVEHYSGEIGIAVDPDLHTVSLNATRGSATIAFNDSSHNSVVFSVPEGKQYFFEDDTRIGRLKSN